MGMRIAILSLAVAVTVAAAPFAQEGNISDSVNRWVVVSQADDFTGESTTFAARVGDDQRLNLLVSCPGVMISMQDRGLFQGGTVDVRWDDGPVETFTFVDLDRTLVYEGVDFARKLAEHAEVRVRVTKYRNEQATDTFDLSDAAAAIDAMGCERR